MKNKTTIAKIGTIALGTILSLSVALPAFAADVTTSVGADVNVGGVSATTHVRANASTTRAANQAQRAQNQDQRINTQSDTEVKNRITALNTLAARIQSMQNVSAGVKSTLGGEITTEIGNLTAVDAKVNADTSTTSKRDDLQTITADYRIYALIIPQANITAAADRVNTIVGMITTIDSKLDTRISQAQSSGKNVTSLTSASADIKTKIADASTQASAAVSLTVNLTPDQGDATKAAANKTALKSALADIKTAVADLKTARTDMGIIVNGVKGTNVNASSTTAVSASSTAQ
jgi:hypothetical protein